MAEHFSFFDAILQDDGTYDREYNAEKFTKYFGALVTTGILKGMGNMLAVSGNGSNMVTKINTGIAFVEAKCYENDSFKELTHDTETLGNSRIDRIVIRMDLSTEARYVKAFIKKGVPSTNPVAPTLTQTANLYEISLAQVKIVGGQTFIATNAVTDERGKDVICPWAGSNILPNFNQDGLQEVLDKVDNMYMLTAPDGKAKVLPNGTDLNTVVDSGLYYIESGVVNGPINNSCHLEVKADQWNVYQFVTNGRSNSNDLFIFRRTGLRSVTNGPVTNWGANGKPPNMYNTQGKWGAIKSGIFETSWIDLPLGSGWSKEHSYLPARYRRIGDVVTVQCTAVKAASGYSIMIAQLPTGFRAAVAKQQPAEGSTTKTIYIKTNSSGGIFVGEPWQSNQLANQSLYFEISFITEDPYPTA